MKEPETNICESAVLSVDAAAFGKSQTASGALAAANRAASSLSVAFHFGAPLGDKSHQKFSAVTSSTQCSAKFLKTGDWGRFNENGRALPRHGRRMHQMGGRGVYGRSARVVSAACANLA
jgi:hypothetical protein